MKNEIGEPAPCKDAVSGFAAAGAPPSDGDLSVCSHFDRQVLAHPENIAVNLAGQRLTYKELDVLAEALAQRLRQRGIGVGELVGVLLERSTELIVSLVAVLKAGSAYVPLDCHYPAERLLWMAGDSGIKTIITSKTLAAHCPKEIADVLLVDLGDLGKAIAVTDAKHTINPCIDGEQPAYVMYTSGSTGTPKGVVIPHRGIVRLVCGADFVNIGPEDVFLHLSSCSFDASTFEIWGALLNGARLAILPPGPLSLGAVGEAIRSENVTVLWLTSGLFNLMIDQRIDELKPIRQLLVGGEALSVPHVERALAGLPETQLINGYGPTENTTFTCCYRIPRDAMFPHGVPIGFAIRGTDIHIFDEALRPLPTGEVGELVTGGAGLALGYWRRPELTLERFIDDPVGLIPGAKLYRTGDLARKRPDGAFEFLGRRDAQIKIRGFRIEPGEIEAALRQHPGIRDCAVCVSEGPGAAKRLIGYVARRTEGKPSAADLREFLNARLPGHFVPSAWEFPPELPLNQNGKVDRAALLSLKAKRSGGSGELPATALENVIASLWREVLGERTFNATDNFFDVGGDSLMIARIHDRLCERDGPSVRLTDLFRFPTIRLLAKYLNEQTHCPAETASAGMERGHSQRKMLERFQKLS